MTNFICKLFHLIPRNELLTRLGLTKALMEVTENGLRNKWKAKELTEWSFYKKLWTLRGRVRMLEDIANNIERK